MAFNFRSALGFICALVMVAFTGCSNKSDEGRGGLTIAVIPKGTTHEFWKSIHAGAVKAQRELEAQGIRVNLIWKGPLREDDRDQQIQVVENFIGRKVAGIVLAPLDSQALIAPVETAQKANIPVVIIDSGLKTDQYASFVATDNFKGGVMGGEHLGQLLGGKGRVILLRYQVGSASTEEREAGFLEAMKKFPGIQIVSSDQYTGATRESAYQAAQNVLNRFGKDVDGMFAPCEPITVGITMALRDLNRAGAVKVVGFDAGAQPVDALKKGEVHALILQNPVRMGYLGVMSVVKKIQGQPVEKRIDTGVALVTKENMANADMSELLNPPLKTYLNE